LGGLVRHPDIAPSPRNTGTVGAISVCYAVRNHAGRSAGVENPVFHPLAKSIYPNGAAFLRPETNERGLR
jgi:hypothetical protein